MESDKLTKVLSFIVLLIAVGCAAMAVHYRNKHDQVQKRMVKVERALEPVRDYAGKAGSEGEGKGVYDFLGVLEQKDAEIKELEQLLHDSGSGPMVPDSRPPINPDPPPGAVNGPTPVAEDPVPRGTLDRHEEFLNSIEISEMGPGGYEHHLRLQEVMSQMQELLAAVQQSETPIEQEDLAMRLALSMKATGKMWKVERGILFYSTARQLGFDEEMARWFVDYVTYIYEMTSPENVKRTAWEKDGINKLPALPAAPAFEVAPQDY